MGISEKDYTIENFRQEIKKSTGKENFPLLKKKDIPLIRQAVIEYLQKCKREGVKTEIIQSIVVPLRMKGLDNILFHEFEYAVSAEYRWHLGDALSYSFVKTEENVQKINSLLKKFHDFGIGRLLFIIQKHHLLTCFAHVASLLEKGDDSVITAAIETFGIIGNSMTIPLIEPFVKSSNSFVKNEARKSIAKLKKQPEIPQ